MSGIILPTTTTTAGQHDTNISNNIDITSSSTTTTTTDSKTSTTTDWTSMPLFMSALPHNITTNTDLTGIATIITNDFIDSKLQKMKSAHKFKLVKNRATRKQRAQPYTRIQHKNKQYSGDSSCSDVDEHIDIKQIEQQTEAQMHMTMWKL